MKNTKQIEKVIGVAGLKIGDTLKALQKECEKIGIDFEKVNHVSVSKYGDQKVRIWVYNHDKKQNKYECFNNNVALTIPEYKEKSEKVLFNIFNKYNAKRLGENRKATNGYTLHKTNGNTPKELKQFNMRKDFICFIAKNEYGQFRYFLVDDYGDTLAFEYCYMDGVVCSNTKQQANETRKKAVEIFALFGDVEYNQKAAEKHNKRYAKKLYLDFNKRYNFDMVKNYMYSDNDMRITYYSNTNNYNLYNKANIAGYCLDIPEGQQEQEKAIEYIKTHAFDKNGYFILANIENMKKRARARKEQKEKEQFNNFDASSFVDLLQNMRKDLIEKNKKVCEKMIAFEFDSLLYFTHRIDYTNDVKKYIDRTVERINAKEFASVSELINTYNEMKERYEKSVFLVNMFLTLSRNDMTSSNEKNSNIYYSRVYKKDGVWCLGTL